MSIFVPAMSSIHQHAAWVLIADYHLPSGGVGSWSQRITYLLQNFGENRFQYLISEAGNEKLDSEFTRQFACKQHKSRLANKLQPSIRYKEYAKAIETILLRHEHAIMVILDSVRVKNALWKWLQKKQLTHRTKIIYYQCGYSTYLTADQYLHFAEGIHHMIMLTKNAYRFELEHRPAMPFGVSILHNPVDNMRFYPTSTDEKIGVRQLLKLDAAKIHFLWAAYDRPKKGLQVILDAWNRFYRPDMNVALQVVGVSRAYQLPGVTFHGKLHNDAMPQWMQACDIGISSSLWTEGFSLSLSEQVSAGLLAIASTAGCVAEFFIDGRHGIAIQDPNIAEEWVEAFEKALAVLPDFRRSIEERKAPEFQTFDVWCHAFSQIVLNVEQQLLATDWSA